MRTSGILMPIFSLPSDYGIGTLGKEAFRFVDFLEKAGQSYWQILPLNPTNYGDSPYQSFSSFAGNPYFIDIDLLIEDGLLTEKQAKKYDFGSDLESIDYGKLYKNRLPLLKEAFEAFKADEKFTSFLQENDFWLSDYALFMALKNAHNDCAWSEWEKPLQMREPAAMANAIKKYSKEIEFYRFVQFLFYKQWYNLKEYANSKGVGIIGDIPIYVAYDSVDVWANPSQFLLDSELKPEMVAGCPPDAFSEDGQLWGNPLYNWQAMKENSFKWWKGYLGFALKRYDLTRIDHFRGFESFYAIPYGEKSAQNGKWIKGPDMELFDALKAEFGKKLPIIAEDLGYLTPAVRRMLKSTGFPGMKVLQFAFSSEEESDYLPHKFGSNCVVYTGTHDNDTIIGWLKTAEPEEAQKARRYINFEGEQGFNWAMIKAAMMSVADICIIMMNDIVGLGSEARINIPSTLGGNWQWRIKPECINEWLAEIVRENTILYGRIPKKSQKTR
ncbi:MAG: 4-alpha-glucanotransferase [Clostridia bacterium]|nr:4-alpha-glucanotransferase [Clostridia bacterium]